MSEHQVGPASTLLQNGEMKRLDLQGPALIMVTAVPGLPMDRPNLSKDYLAGKADPAWMPLRGDESWYTARDIELRLETQVTKLDPKTHTLTLDKGDTLHYDKLLLATGGIP